MVENIIHPVEQGRSELWNSVGRSYGGESYPYCRTRQVGAMEENIVPHAFRTR